MTLENRSSTPSIPDTPEEWVRRDAMHNWDYKEDRLKQANAAAYDTFLEYLYRTYEKHGAKKMGEIAGIGCESARLVFKKTNLPIGQHGGARAQSIKLPKEVVPTLKYEWALYAHHNGIKRGRRRGRKDFNKLLFCHDAVARHDLPCSWNTVRNSLKSNRHKGV